MSFKEVRVNRLDMNPFTKIGQEWMLISAGDIQDHNSMTASWGGFGVLWHKNVATVYVRPQRFTKVFIDTNDTFTLSFFGRGYRKELNYLGSVSGRDEDKVKNSGLTVRAFDGTAGYEEAEMVIVCKKIYRGDIDPDRFIDPSIDENYPDKDYHSMYIGEIQKVYVNE